MNRREERRREGEESAEEPTGASDQQSQAAAANQPAGGEDTVAKLQELAQLHESGALTDEEFATAKAKLLG